MGGITLTRRGMPRNMTMEQPRPRIIRLESNSDVTPTRQEDDVSPGRVDEVERLVAGHRVEGCVLLREDDDVHPVPVERVGD